MPVIDEANAQIARLADGKTIRYVNINEQLAFPDNQLREGMANDGLHLTPKAYQVWADALKPIFTEILGAAGRGRPRAAADRRSQRTDAEDARKVRDLTARTEQDRPEGRFSEVSGVHARVRRSRIETQRSPSVGRRQRFGPRFARTATSAPRSASPPPCISSSCSASAARSTKPAKTTRTCPNCPCSSKPAKAPTTRNSPKPRCRNPRPNPVEEVHRRPGHRRTDARRADAGRRHADAGADARRRASSTTPAALAEPVPDEPATVLTTTAARPTQVPLVAEPAPEARPKSMPQPEQVMLTRNVQQLAQKLLDTNTTATTISWQQDGQQYSARVMRQPAADSTGPRTGDRRDHDQQGRQAHEDAPVAQAPGVLAFHAAREQLGSEHPAARRRDRRPLPQQHRDSA